MEQAARRVMPSLQLKQFRYLAPMEKSAEEVLSTISLFNPNKEIAYVQKGKQSWFLWNPEKKNVESANNPLSGLALLRRDEPDTEAQGLGEGSETGVCYSLQGTSGELDPALQAIFANPHASTLEVLL